jgi:4-alpha-glucanotransferase
VWARRDQFWLDASLGVPPTTPEEEPQDWGLPVYDWSSMKADGWSWMKLRAARLAELFDAYRVDHVVGLYRSYYKRADEHGMSPPEEPDQIEQGETLLAMLHEHAEIVAEDLGLVPPFIRESLTRLQVPGYRVLRWEKDDDVYRDPAAWPTCAVATTGTHDTNSAAEWYDALSAEERAALAKVPGLAVAETHATYDLEVKDAVLRLLYASPCDLVLLSLEDALGRKGQVNVPGTVSADNWSLRMPEPIDALAADEGQRAYLAKLAADSGRAV